MKVGDRVRRESKFLRNTGQFTGPDAPTCSGPWARGVIESMTALNGDRQVCDVRWDDGVLMGALDINLEVC
jgi:hypothetical protein